MRARRALRGILERFFCWSRWQQRVRLEVQSWSCLAVAYGSGMAPVQENRSSQLKRGLASAMVEAVKKQASIRLTMAGALTSGTRLPRSSFALSIGVPSAKKSLIIHHLLFRAGRVPGYDRKGLIFAK